VKAAILAVVAIVVGLLVYVLARPHVAAPPPAPRQTSATPSDSVPAPDRGAGAVPSQAQPESRAPTGPIAPPRTAEEKELDAIEQRRGALYARLHLDMGATLVAVRPSDADAATLDIYAAADSPGNALSLFKVAQQANVGYYGFRHIRFFAPNPAGSMEKFHLDSEASADESGNWSIFKK